MVGFGGPEKVREAGGEFVWREGAGVRAWLGKKEKMRRSERGDEGRFEGFDKGNTLRSEGDEEAELFVDLGRGDGAAPSGRYEIFENVACFFFATGFEIGRKSGEEAGV